MKQEDKTGFQKWLQDSYLSNDLKDVISKTVDVVGTASAVVGSVMSIVGIVGAVVKLVDFLKFAQPGQDPIELLAKEVLEIRNLLIADFQWNQDADWNRVLSDLDEAAKNLREFMRTAQSPDANPPGLLTDAARVALHDNCISPTRHGLTELAPPQSIPAVFQQGVNNPPLLYALDNPAYYAKVDAGTLGVDDLPSIDPVPGPELPVGALDFPVWDYRRALPHIVYAVVQLISCYKVYDPAFRTTRRFEADLNDLADNLELVAARWLNCIYWTRDYPIDAQFDPSDWPEADCPEVVDTRARARVNHSTEHPEIDYFVPMPGEPEYSRRRVEYGQKLLVYCGFSDFRDWIKQIRALVGLPKASESVDASARMFATRELRRTEQIPGPKHRTVKVFHVDWIIVYDLTVQPQLAPYDYAQNLPITYEFFLESYEQGALGDDGGRVDQDALQGLIDRVQLHAGVNRRANIRVFSPDVFVPAEDDGTYGTATEHPVLYAPPNASSSDRARTRSIVDVVHDAQSLAHARTPVESRLHDGSSVDTGVHRRDDDTEPTQTLDISNPVLAELARIAVALGGRTIAEGPPRKAEYLGGQPTDATIGYSLTFGPDGKIAQGFVSFRAWNVLHHDVNVGALYLVVEEEPPYDPAVRIKTYLPLPINPTEKWYAAYSRTGPHFVPAG